VGLQSGGVGGAGVVNGAGHQHVHLGADAVGAVPQVGEVRVGRGAHPPVGDDNALVAPLAAQHGGAQVVVVVAPYAVDFVVAGHDILGLALGDADFKALQIDFPQGPLGHLGIVV